VGIFDMTVRSREAASSQSSFAVPPSGEWAVRQVDRMRRGVSFGNYREVQGIGERAFLLDRKGAPAVLCVFESP
jgi:hypothetical protein